MLLRSRVHLRGMLLCSISQTSLAKQSGSLEAHSWAHLVNSCTADSMIAHYQIWDPRSKLMMQAKYDTCKEQHSSPLRRL